MRLKTTDQIPEILVNDYLGNQVNTGNFSGKRLLISFFRDAACPFCNLRVYELIRRHKEFEDQGIQLIVFFTSDAKLIKKYAGSQQPPFPVIPDPELVWYKKFGVEESLWGMFRAMFKLKRVIEVMRSGYFSLKSLKERNTLPADFLVGEDRRIIIAHYGKDFADHLDFKEILSGKQ